MDGIDGPFGHVNSDDLAPGVDGGHNSYAWEAGGTLRYLNLLMGSLPCLSPQLPCSEDSLIDEKDVLIPGLDKADDVGQDGKLSLPDVLLLPLRQCILDSDRTETDL